MGPNASRLDMRFAMAETPKLSVEKALEKLRAADALKSKDARRTEEMDALDDEIKRMRAQDSAWTGTSDARQSVIKGRRSKPSRWLALGQHHVRRTRRHRRAGRLRFDAVRRNVRFAPIRMSSRSMPTTSAKVWTRPNSRLG